MNEIERNKALKEYRDVARPTLEPLREEWEKGLHIIHHICYNEHGGYITVATEKNIRIIGRDRVTLYHVLHYFIVGGEYVVSCYLQNGTIEEALERVLKIVKVET